MTTFLLMRHGLTTWNREKRLQGTFDVPLCEEGRDMARLWGKRLRERALDRILCSNLERARETARLANMFLGLEVQEDARLAEQDWGDWTGASKAGMAAMRDSVREQEARGFGFTPPNGESRARVLERAVAALSEVAGTHPDETVLVVTHNGVIKCLAHHLSGSPYMPGSRNILKSYRLHRLEHDGKALHLAQLNMEL